MENLKCGVVKFSDPPYIKSFASAVGIKENDGPLAGKFDFVAESSDMGASSWEAAESLLQKNALKLALQKAFLSEKEVDCLFGGDLQNQCTASSYAIRDTEIPFAGLYGACSTLSEGLCLAGITTDAGAFDITGVLTSSHFCSAERQFRYPLNYGGQRTMTATWTATAAGCIILTKEKKNVNALKEEKNIRVKSCCIGKITDTGTKDPGNMGAAMAYAAYLTITTFFEKTTLTPADFDIIITGDLGAVGTDILLDLFKKNGDIVKNHFDCGLMLFENKRQDVHSGASGCGCSAAVLCAEVLPKMISGELKNVLFAGTGALMSPTIVQQGESIPGVAHAVHLTTQ